MSDVFPRIVKSAELQLGDVVRLFDGAFGDGIVEQIADGNVHFARPYLARPDFSYTGGVIVLTGIEHFTQAVDSSKTVVLLERPKLK